MDNTVSNSGGNKTALVKIQRFGNFLSGMVMPNLGVFVAWGILTALFIPTGWIPNDYLGELVGPILTYAMPMLIGYTGGKMVHGNRGGAIGVLATMGVIVGADVTMLSGAMLMGPLAAWLMKKVDGVLDGKFKPGFEMLVSNFSMGILGLIIVIAGYVAIGPVMQGILNVLSGGVNWVLEHKLLPLLSIFVAPAQVLFLNNAINHGIMAPLGLEQVAAAGKSILFLVDPNCGPSVGTLLAVSIFGRGMAKRTAPMAAIIAGIGGIGEVYFPFVLMKPKLVFATMGGMATSLGLFQLLGGGTVATPSPGSFFAMLMLTPKGAMFGNLVGFFAGMAVSFTIGMLLLKTERGGEEEEKLADGSLEERAKYNNAVLSQGTQGVIINKIVVACDAGMGSSAMGASILKTQAKKAMLDVDISNTKIEEIPSDVDLIITHTQLVERAKKLHADGRKKCMTITNFMEGDQYKEIVEYLKQVKSGKETVEKKTEVVEKKHPTPISKEVLNSSNIRLNQYLDTKEAAIKKTGDILVENGYVKPEYVQSMQEREKTVSVYVGNNVAIPHGTGDSDELIIKSGISIVQVPKGVKFGNETAYVLIGIAGKGNSHLDILSKIAEFCSEPYNVEKIKLASSEKDILDMLM